MGIAFLLGGELLGVFAWHNFGKAMLKKDSKKAIIFFTIGIVAAVLVLLAKKFDNIPWFIIIQGIFLPLVSISAAQSEKEKDTPIKYEKYHGD